MFAMIGTTEAAIVGLVIVVLFGARRLPELGRSVGEGIKEFRNASRGLIGDDEEVAPESTAPKVKKIK